LIENAAKVVNKSRIQEINSNSE